MAKQFGLIIPGQQNKSNVVERAISKPSIFDESSDSEEEEPPQLKMKAAPIEINAMQRRLARRQQEQALEEDPTIYQYDECYDEIQAERAGDKPENEESRKPKYIGYLMRCAERRKLENERRVERQVQKERDQEGEEFRDKETFVTAAYRKKLEELRHMEEQEKRDAYLEAIGDVTKQPNLDGFYRHLYEQKLGTEKQIVKPELPKNPAQRESETKQGMDEDDKEHPNVEDAIVEEEHEMEELYYKPIDKMLKTKKRAYRKRETSGDEAVEKNLDIDDEQQATKKAHLQNNIDADSDFSIDSSDDTSSDEEEQNGDKDTASVVKALNNNTNNESIEANTNAENNDAKEVTSEEPPASTPPASPPPTVNKVDIWKKRTVGDVFDAAVKRYFQRKAAASA